MTILRRRSTKSNEQAPEFEALASTSAFWLADSDNAVLVSSEDEDEDTTSLNNQNSNNSDESVTNMEGGDEDGLVEAFSDFSVKMGPSNETVQVTLDLPSDVPAEDLNVEVTDGILRVSGEISSCCGTINTEAPAEVEQEFLLDEQSLDVDNVSAHLSSDGTLTVIAPKKANEDITLTEHQCIREQRPPDDPFAFRVVLELPGVNKEDLHVSYANGNLRLVGNRHFGRVRSFKRTIPVDTQRYDVDKMKCFLYGGQLIVTVPMKTARGGSRNIEIETRRSVTTDQDDTRTRLHALSEEEIKDMMDD